MTKKKSSSMMRLLQYIKGHWYAYLAGGFYISVVEAAFQVMVASLLKLLVDASLAGDLNLLVKSIGWAMVGLLTLAGLMPGIMRLFAGAVEKATLALRQDLFNHILDLPMAYHEQTHSGDAVTRLTNDVNQAKEAIGEPPFQMLSLIVTATVTTAYLGLIHWQFVVLAFTLTILPILTNRYAGKPMRRASSEVQASLASLNAKLKDMLVGMPVVRAFNLEQHFTDAYASANAETRRLGCVLSHRQGLNIASNNLLSSATFSSMLALGTFLLLRGEITPGEVLAAGQLCNGITNPMRAFGETWANLQRALGAADRVFTVLDEPQECWQAVEQVADISDVDGSMVCMREVAFAYANSNLVLTDINLKVRPGSVVALAGPSGGGKSTIFKLLLGFYEACAGECYLRGRPLRSYSLEELREQIAFVPQDPYLFAGTIYENIAYGRPDATPEEIFAAAKAANAHDFIMDLPEGYDTQVGERGTQLSGGQRQRVAIARALLKDAPLLLLDEATSSLDSESEHLVQEALQRLMQGRTTLVIAHRLSTIEHADYIYVVADGRIVEAGTHSELLDLDGLYRRLYENQLRAA
ncbi:MAG: ABC transporter ATP-binding protein [Firmicutes bacterium]|nr:ABC transporter ATP-binding protein [Bacillota bacterium]